MSQLMMPHETFPRPTGSDEFDVAIMCALRYETDAVEAMFDQFWEDDEHQYEKMAGDINSYTYGRMGRHNVVLVYMAGIGKAHAASVAACFRMSFPRIRLGLVVGVCGGVPQPPASVEEILLGDVIVSTGVIQIDFGRQYDDQALRKDTLQDNLGRPSMEIGAFLNQMQGLRARSNLRRLMTEATAEFDQKEEFKHWQFPGRDSDHLYDSGYRHKHHEANTLCPICAHCLAPDDAVCKAALNASCAQLQCDKARLIPRQRSDKYSMLHFGTLASGDVVMKSALHRDRIARDERVLGFEMEGAGIWDHFPTVIIKGVCDYADSHKHKKWQPYAAFMAAAYAKAFLRQWRGVERKAAQSLVKYSRPALSVSKQVMASSTPSVVENTSPSAPPDRSNRRFRIQPSNFFSTGRVFRALGTVNSRPPLVERCLIMLRPTQGSIGSVLCVPIFNIGSPYRRFKPPEESQTQHHLLVHIYGTRFRFDREDATKTTRSRPICVRPSTADQDLGSKPRIHLKTSYQVGYNVPVMDIGMVDHEDMSYLLDCFREDSDSKDGVQSEYNLESMILPGEGMSG